jgi:hypothetical protein
MGILDKKVVLITGAGGCIFGPPYQFIIAARNELRTRGSTQIISRLSGRSFSAAPNGTVFFKNQVAWDYACYCCGGTRLKPTEIIGLCFIASLVLMRSSAQFHFMPDKLSFYVGQISFNERTHSVCHHRD